MSDLAALPDLATLIVFAGASIVLNLTPGPDMLLCASRSLAQGRVAGFLTYAGIAAGCYVHATAAALGLSEVMVRVPAAYDAIRFAGAAYLVYLAIKALRSKPADFAPDAAIAQKSGRRIFMDGFLTNVLNPKVALFVLALFPQFVRADGPILIQSLVLATVLNTTGLVVNGAVVLAAGRLRTLFSGSGRVGRWPQYLLASVFAALALRVAVTSRG